MITFREYFLSEDANPNIHSIKKGDSVSVKINGQDVEFTVTQKGQSRSAGGASTAEGAGHYVDLDAVKDYGGGMDNISPTVAGGVGSFHYRPGNALNMPLDALKLKIDALEATWTQKVEGAPGAVAANGAGQAEAPPGYGAGGAGGPTGDLQIGQGKQYLRDTINQKGAESSAASGLGKMIGRNVDAVAHRALGRDAKPVTNQGTVFQQGGPGGKVYGQFKKTGNPIVDAPPPA